jgi:hypothetical protein
MPLETPIPRAITPPHILFYAHPVIPSIPSAPALASCASINLRYAFTFKICNVNSNISKKHFLSGTDGYVNVDVLRQIRQIPGADYFLPCINTTCRVAYRPPIASSPFPLAPSVSYFEQTLWLRGQL